MGTTETDLGIRDAADLCAVSDETIRRRLREGRFPRAYRDGHRLGPWRIPVADLFDAGLAPAVGDSSQRTAVPLHEPEREELSELRDRVARLEGTVQTLERLFFASPATVSIPEDPTA